MNIPFSHQNRKKIITTIALSILIHLLLLYFFHEHIDLLADKIPPQPVWVDLKNIQAPEKLVDMPKPLYEEIPEKPTAESLYNQKVAQETTNAMPARPQTQQDKPEQKELPKNDNIKKAMEELQAAKIAAGEMPQQSQQRIPGMPGQNVSSNSFPDDYYPDYKIGNRTYINTLANPNLRYFVELKRKFKLTFNPAPALRGHINEISSGQINVILGVTVNAKGELVDLIVIRNSGMQAYDQEGIRTVRSSSPFSAPPTNLLDKDGTLSMAWNFIVYL